VNAGCLTLKALLLATILSLAAAPATPARAGEPEQAPVSMSIQDLPHRYTFEADLYAGYSRLYLPSPSRRGELSASNVGVAVAVGSLFRSPYFLSPFVELAFHRLLRTTDAVDLGPALGGSGVAHNWLSTLGLTAGGALDVWRLRVRAGVALDFVYVHSTVNGRTLSASERDMGYVLAVGGYLWRNPRFKIGLEARTRLILNANLGFVSLGATAAGDLFSW
jgi:hypothetical protein